MYLLPFYILCLSASTLQVIHSAPVLPTEASTVTLNNASYIPGFLTSGLLVIPFTPAKQVYIDSDVILKTNIITGTPINSFVNNPHTPCNKTKDKENPIDNVTNPPKIDLVPGNESIETDSKDNSTTLENLPPTTWETPVENNNNTEFEKESGKTASEEGPSTSATVSDIDSSPEVITSSGELINQDSSNIVGDVKPQSDDGGTTEQTPAEFITPLVAESSSNENTIPDAINDPQKTPVDETFDLPTNPSESSSLTTPSDEKDSSGTLTEEQTPSSDLTTMPEFNGRPNDKISSEAVGTTGEIPSESYEPPVAGKPTGEMTQLEDIEPENESSQETKPQENGNTDIKPNESSITLEGENLNSENKRPDQTDIVQKPSESSSSGDEIVPLDEKDSLENLTQDETSKSGPSTTSEPLNTTDEKLSLDEKLPTENTMGEVQTPNVPTQPDSPIIGISESIIPPQTEDSNDKSNQSDDQKPTENSSEKETPKIDSLPTDESQITSEKIPSDEKTSIENTTDNAQESENPSEEVTLPIDSITTPESQANYEEKVPSDGEITADNTTGEIESPNEPTQSDANIVNNESDSSNESIKLPEPESLIAEVKPEDEKDSTDKISENETLPSDSTKMPELDNSKNNEMSLGNKVDLQNTIEEEPPSEPRPSDKITELQGPTVEDQDTSTTLPEKSESSLEETPSNDSTNFESLITNNENVPLDEKVTTENTMSEGESPGGSTKPPESDDTSIDVKPSNEPAQTQESGNLADEIKPDDENEATEKPLGEETPSTTPLAASENVSGEKIPLNEKGGTENTSGEENALDEPVKSYESNSSTNDEKPLQEPSQPPEPSTTIDGMKLPEGNDTELTSEGEKPFSDSDITPESGSNINENSQSDQTNLTDKIPEEETSYLVQETDTTQNIVDIGVPNELTKPSESDSINQENPSSESPIYVEPSSPSDGILADEKDSLETPSEEIPSGNATDEKIPSLETGLPQEATTSEVEQLSEISKPPASDSSSGDPTKPTDTSETQPLELTNSTSITVGGEETSNEPINPLNPVSSAVESAPALQTDTDNKPNEKPSTESPNLPAPGDSNNLSDSTDYSTPPDTQINSGNSVVNPESPTGSENSGSLLIPQNDDVKISTDSGSTSDLQNPLENGEEPTPQDGNEKIGTLPESPTNIATAVSPTAQTVNPSAGVLPGQLDVNTDENCDVYSATGQTAENVGGFAGDSTVSQQPSVVPGYGTAGNVPAGTQPTYSNNNTPVPQYGNGYNSVAQPVGYSPQPQYMNGNGLPGSTNMLYPGGSGTTGYAPRPTGYNPNLQQPYGNNYGGYGQTPYAGNTNYYPQAATPYPYYQQNAGMSTPYGYQPAYSPYVQPQYIQPTHAKVYKPIGIVAVPHIVPLAKPQTPSPLARSHATETPTTKT